jgi:hypothetical protein
MCCKAAQRDARRDSSAPTILLATQTDPSLHSAADRARVPAVCKRLTLFAAICVLGGCSSSSTNSSGSGGSAGSAVGGSTSGGAPSGGGSAGTPVGGSAGVPSGGGGSGGAAGGGSGGSAGTTPCDIPNCTSRGQCCEGVYATGAAAYRALVTNACTDNFWCLQCAQGGAACSFICAGASTASLYDCLACGAQGCASDMQALDVACSGNADCKAYRDCLLPCPPS